jgi:hypothetical protein
VRLSDLQLEAAERGDPEMACYSCSHFRLRQDGMSGMGRCSLVDEPQFEFGVCFEYEWDGSVA